MNTNFFVEIGVGLGSAFSWAVSSGKLALQSTLGYLLSLPSYRPTSLPCDPMPLGPHGPMPAPAGFVPVPTLGLHGPMPAPAGFVPVPTRGLHGPMPAPAGFFVPVSRPLERGKRKLRELWVMDQEIDRLYPQYLNLVRSDDFIKSLEHYIKVLNFYVVTWDRVNTLAFRRTLQYGILWIFRIKLDVGKWSTGEVLTAYMI